MLKNSLLFYRFIIHVTILRTLKWPTVQKSAQMFLTPVIVLSQTLFPVTDLSPRHGHISIQNPWHKDWFGMGL